MLAWKKPRSYYIMKLVTTFLLTLGVSFSTVHAQGGDTTIEDSEKTTAQKNADALKEAAKELDAAFLNLPEKQRLEYLQKRARAVTLFQNKRVFETIPLLYELKAIFPNDPQIHNLEGAVYVELRQFKNAKVCFDKAIEIIGDDPKVLFNLAELHFCSNNWQECLKRYKELQKKVPNMQNELGYLVDFKMLLSHLALSEDESLSDKDRESHMVQAKDLALRYSYLDDTPYYYYANCALAFAKDDKTAAGKWVLQARKVFSTSPARLASWDDTLMEFGYVPSQYGKHFSDAPDASLIDGAINR